MRPGRDGPARGIEPGEAAEREARRASSAASTAARGPTATIRPSQHATTGGGVGPGRVVGDEAPDLALRRRRAGRRRPA